jgi:phosphoglucosamine mutase
VVRAILSTGCNVENLGVVSSPSLSYLVSKSSAKAAVMITASHNPYQDNGIKIFSADGRKLHDSVERAIEQKIQGELPDHVEQPGEERDVHSSLKGYIDYVAFPFEDTLKGKRIGLDMANGATVGIADTVLRQTGAEVVTIGDKPNGTNINDKCGATDTAQLKRLVLEQKLDTGIALDGDGDRVVLVDNKGRELNGDNLLQILALDRQDKVVVATQMSNMGLENVLRENGVELLRTAVGDRYVLEAMLAKGYKLGGEQSGHIILLDKMPSGDGLLAGLTTLAAAQKSGKSLAEWYDALHLMPQILENIRVEDRSRIDTAKLQALSDEFTKELQGKGRVLLRPSGTEPLVRVMVEAPNAEELVKNYVERVKTILL